MNALIITVTSLLAATVVAVTGGDVHGPVSACDPCGIYSLDHVSPNRLQGFLKFSVFSAYFAASNELTQAKQFYKITDLNGLDLTECCGATYEVEENDMKIQSVHQLLVRAMVNLNDASYLVNSPRMLINSVQRLNTTLCAVQTLDSSSAHPSSSSTTTTTSECLTPSQIDTCTNGIAGGSGSQDVSCRMNMMFRYLINSVQILGYLKDSGRV